MSEVIIYQGKDNTIQIEVQFENETVWLTQKQLAELFNKNVMIINEHIKNIYKEQVLEENATIRKSLIVQKEGNKNVELEIINCDIFGVEHWLDRH